MKRMLEKSKMRRDDTGQCAPPLSLIQQGQLCVLLCMIRMLQWDFCAKNHVVWTDVRTSCNNIWSRCKQVSLFWTNKVCLQSHPLRKAQSLPPLVPWSYATILHPLVLWGTTGFQSDQQVVAQNNGMYQNNLAWTSTRRIGLIISVVTSTVTLNICRQKPAPASSAWWLVRHAAFKWAKRFSQTTTT